MDSIFEQIWAKRFVFLGSFFFVFTLSYIVLLALDFLPESVTVEDETSITEEKMEATNDVEKEVLEAVEYDTSEVESVAETNVMPIQISIEKLGKTITVLNPTSRTIADLDEALLSGVVRHPDSATLAQDGNVFILGHSSYLPNVLNSNFQAFNGIQKLEWGDTIEVSSEDTVFVYRVEKVFQARAQDVTVPIAGTEKLLTLATCNSFGSIDDRYIVEAKQIGTRSI